MKYIRTEDGRIAKYFPPIFSTCDNRIGYPSSKGLIFEEEILNQADTIEELCDECISVLENGKGSHIWHESEFEEKTPYLFHNARMFKEDDEIIYGAIWTDRGLIYVAKMNDRGELELL